jgi:isopropylmalate/isohomocitrate dehydrogenase-like protein
MSKICVIPGDGIGPEVTQACVEVLEALSLDLSFETTQVGKELHKKEGVYIKTETMDLAKDSDAILFGTITSPLNVEYISPLLLIRWGLGLYANVRPIKCINPEFCLAPLDIVIIRENTEGLYGAVERFEDDKVITERSVSEKACRRIIEYAFEYAVAKNRKMVSCVHKANVLRTSDGMFRQLFYGSAVNYAVTHKIRSNDYLVDAAAMHLVKDHDFFDTIVTLNLYGDILSDEAAGLIGGLGFAPSANIGKDHILFEPVHGSAPDIAGKGIANPTASILSGAMMLEHLGHKPEAELLEMAVNQVYTDRKKWTVDIGGKCNTREFTEHLINKINELKQST